MLFRSNPKQIRNAKHGKMSFRFSCFVLVSDFAIRISDFLTTCHMNKISIRCTVTMSDSRFHGVFQALLKEKAARSSRQKDDISVEEEGTSTPEPPALTQGQISVDVYEDGSYLVIKAPIAGVKLSDLDIDVADNVITIRGKREQCDDLSTDQYIAQE